MIAERQSYTAVGTVVPGAGTWAVGLCIKNHGGSAVISDNDYVNGFIQTTN